MDSILTSIKKLLGITEETEYFDTDIIIHINSVLATLTQLGLGHTKGFAISDKSSTWDEFLPDDTRLEMVKSFIFLKVRLLFDPPASSVVVDAMKQSIQELEWRIMVTCEQPLT